MRFVWNGELASKQNKQSKTKQKTNKQKKNDKLSGKNNYGFLSSFCQIPTKQNNHRAIGIDCGENFWSVSPQKS